MNLILILLPLMLFTSISSAEVYRWEDAEGVHFTDNPESVPAGSSDMSGEPETVPPDTALAVRNSALTARINHDQLVRSNIELTRIETEAVKQQQTAAKAQVHLQKIELEQDVLQSLSRYILIGFFVAAALFIAWIIALVDIFRGEFIRPEYKKTLDSARPLSGAYSARPLSGAYRRTVLSALGA